MPDAVEPKDARVEVASGEVFVVDVRDADEWNENTDRIPGSVNVPADEIESRLDELPADRQLLVVCGDGRRSAEVAERLSGEGREVKALEGGVSKWKSDRLLTQPSPDADPPKGEDEPPVEEPEDSDEEPGSGGVAQAEEDPDAEPEERGDREGER